MLKITENAKMSTLDLTGIFIAIGSEPNSAQWQGFLPSDQVGYVITSELIKMKIPGIFAGDILHNSARQAITAAGDGATAAISVERFLSF